VKDEPVKDLLGNVNKDFIQRLLEREYGGDKSAVPTIDYLAVQSTSGLRLSQKLSPVLLAHWQKLAIWIMI